MTVLPPISLSAAQMEEDTLDYFCWRYCPQLGDTALDVGAGLGTELATFSRLVGPGGRVVAVEAHPRSFAVAERMVQVNRLNNVEVHQVAIWNEAGELTMSDGVSADINSVVAVRDGGSEVIVRATTLDEFVDGLGLRAVDYMKMNIEGAERQAVEGGRETLRRTGNVAISCHDFVADLEGGSDAMGTHRYVRAALDDLGFEVRVRDDPRPFVRSYFFGYRGS